jgi:hypothetical protein
MDNIIMVRSLKFEVFLYFTFEVQRSSHGLRFKLGGEISKFADDDSIYKSYSFKRRAQPRTSNFKLYEPSRSKIVHHKPF